jgi:hypothetical protein
MGYTLALKRPIFFAQMSSAAFTVALMILIYTMFL